MEVGNVILARTDEIEKIICLVGCFRTQCFMYNFNVVVVVFFLLSFSKTPKRSVCSFHEFRVHFSFSGEIHTEIKKEKNVFYGIVVT